jgi:hypothetical protein
MENRAHVTMTFENPNRRCATLSPKTAWHKGKLRRTSQRDRPGNPDSTHEALYTPVNGEAYQYSALRMKGGGLTLCAESARNHGKVIANTQLLFASCAVHD